MTSDDGALSKAEHDDMRAVIVAEAPRIDGRARRRQHLVGGVTAIMLIGGVIAGTASIYGLRAPVSVGPAETPAPVTPKECLEFVDATQPQVSETGPIVEAIAEADLPAGVVISPGVTVRSSDDEAGAAVVIARVCSQRLDRAGLVHVGNAIAEALDEAPNVPVLTQLVIESWIPIEGGAIAQDAEGEPIHTSFSSYDWSDSAEITEDAWK